MGQRHNRRRTRPRSANRSNPNQETSFQFLNQVSGSPILSHSSIWNSNSPPSSIESPPARYSTTCISRGSPGLVPAPTWHYGYTAWKIREIPRRETGGVDAEQCRLFGGEPGDDVSLCDRMREYFDGLDYIDSARHSTLGD